MFAAAYADWTSVDIPVNVFRETDDGSTFHLLNSLADIFFTNNFAPKPMTTRTTDRQTDRHRLSYHSVYAYKVPFFVRFFSELPNSALFFLQYIL